MYSFIFSTLIVEIADISNDRMSFKSFLFYGYETIYGCVIPVEAEI